LKLKGGSPVDFRYLIARRIAVKILFIFEKCPSTALGMTKNKKIAAKSLTATKRQ